MINVAAKEIATALKKVKEDEGDVKRDVNVASLNFMVTMHLLHEYMHLIVSIPEDTQVDEELLSLDKQHLVGEAIREFLVERKDKEMTSNFEDQQLANRVIEAVRVMNETETGASSKERKSMQLTKGREVMGIVTATSDLTLVELICHIFCWNVVRAVEKADGDRTELKAFFFAKWGFTTTPNSVKESSQLMKVSKIGDAMVTSRIDSPNEFQLTGSLLSLRQLGDLFRGTAPLEDKLIQTYTIPKKSNAPTDDSSTLDGGKPTKRKRSKKKKKSDEHQSSDNNGSTTDTEETDAKKQRTNDCGNKTIVSQQSGNMTQHELHGLESKDKLIATAMEAAQKQVGSDVLATGLLKNIATAIVNKLFRTEDEIDELIASDDVMATNETTIEAVEGFDVGQPYNEQTGFFEVIKAAWRNEKWRAKHGQQHSMKKFKLKVEEEEKATNWEKVLFEKALKPAIKQIVDEMGKSIVFMTRREGKLVTKEYKVSEGDDNPHNTIYIYGEPTEDNSKCTIKNTKYYWMVPKE